MSKVFIEESTLTSIGDAIRAKTGKSDLIPPGAMPTEIESIETGGADLPEEAFNITGNCQYKFGYGGWDWFIRDYGSRVKTSDITNIEYMFNSSKVENIPFDINIKNGASLNSINNLFGNCENLKSIPKINGKPKLAGSLSYVFFGCYNLRYIPEDFADWFDWSSIENSTSSYTGTMSNWFGSCYSLRSIPMDIFNHVNPKMGGSSVYFYSGFRSCYSLDELVGLPIKYTSTWTSSNAFYYTFENNFRLKNMTFALQENGLPVEVKWKNQTINLVDAGYIEMGISKPMSEWDAEYLESQKQRFKYIIGFNSGITLDKAIYNDETYALLKDDPDSFCIANNYNVGANDYRCWDYSRYNHDSAVATINSLPDTSAYLATQSSGTNTIMFKGVAGAKTDGGAINTLTEEEIAVATAKGWTVSIS